MKQLMFWLVMMLGAATASGQGNGSALGLEAFTTAASRQDAQVLDLRPGSNFEAGHWKDAVHVDGEDSAAVVDYLKGADKDEPILLYCGSGYRSGMAREALIKAGYTDVHDLEGGLEAWEDQEIPQLVK